MGDPTQPYGGRPPAVRSLETFVSELSADINEAVIRRDERIRVLRELAAELLVTKRGDLYDACIDRGTPNDVGFALKAMADALEGK